MGQYRDQPTLVVSDIDGTLLTDQETVGVQTAQTLAMVFAHGVPVVLATGRPPRDIPIVLQQLPFEPWCVCANGAVIFNPEQGELITVSVLSPEDVSYCVRVLLERNPKLGFAVEPVGLNSVFSGNKNYCHAYDDPINIVDDQELLSGSCFKLLVSLPGVPSRELAQLARQVVGHAFEVFYFHEYGLVEIAPKGVNKAAGIQVLAARNGYDTTRVLAFGDMNNDCEMLSWAWCAVAMANASAEVKNIANDSTSSNNDDGVGQYLLANWPSLCAPL